MPQGLAGLEVGDGGFGLTRCGGRSGGVVRCEGTRERELELRPLHRGCRWGVEDVEALAKHSGGVLEAARRRVCLGERKTRVGAARVPTFECRIASTTATI